MQKLNEDYISHEPTKNNGQTFIKVWGNHGLASLNPLDYKHTRARTAFASPLFRTGFPMTQTRVLSADEVELMVRRLVLDISSQWRPTTLVPILNGAYLFGAAMLTGLYDFGIDVELYPLRVKRDISGRPFLMDPLPSFRDKHLLVCDTIYDRGNTAVEVARVLTPVCKSIVFAFLFVRGNDPPKLNGPTFVGMQLGDNHEYLNGYGMDVNGKGRGRISVTSQPASLTVSESLMVLKG